MSGGPIPPAYTQHSVYVSTYLVAAVLGLAAFGARAMVRNKATILRSFGGAR